MSADRQSSENIFRREFWLGVVDARLPALLRIALGLLVLFDLGDRSLDFHAFYTGDGLLPGPGEGMDEGLRWSLFDLGRSRAATLALFVAGFLPAAALAAGYRTRLANVLVWVFELSLQNRNRWIIDGGDAVLLALLFWLMFVDSGAAFSLDVRLGRRKGLAAVPAAGFRMLQLQVAYIYLFTFLVKTGSSWRDGTAVYRAIVSNDWGRGFAPILAQHPRVCAALTWATLAIEGAFPLLVLCPFRPHATRAVAIVAGTALHAGIYFNMRIGIFSQVMPASYLVFVPPSWIDGVIGWVARRRGRPPPAAAAAAAADAVVAALAERQRRWAPLVLALLGAQLGVIVMEPIWRRTGVRVPRALMAELELIGGQQNWRMFSPNAPVIDVAWRAPGLLSDGTAVELTEVLIPGLGSHRRFAYSRWHRMRESLAQKPSSVLLPLGRYICRRYNGRQRGARLVRFALVASVRPTLSAEPPRQKQVFEQDCTPAPAPAPGQGT